MAEKKNSLKGFSPFINSRDASLQSDFDQYYYEIKEKVVFKSTGQKDADGNDLGVAENVFIVNKIDISEFLESQRESVGIEAYIRSLSLQGDDIDSFSTEVDSDSINDYSDMPDTLADVLTAGDKAKAAFANMDPALKGGHTTIDGFLNSLSKDVIDKYIAGKLEALNPAKKEGE